MSDGYQHQTGVFSAGLRQIPVVAVDGIQQRAMCTIHHLLVPTVNSTLGLLAYSCSVVGRQSPPKPGCTSVVRLVAQGWPTDHLGPALAFDRQLEFLL